MTYSQRINELATQPKHLIATEIERLEELKNSLSHSFVVNYEIPNSNGYIALLVDVNGGSIEDVKYITNIKSAALAFLDTLANFLVGKNANTISHISLREIEYFLRDKNSVPSIPDNGAEMYRIFEITNLIQKELVESVQGSSEGGEFGSPTFEDYKKSGKKVYDIEKEGKFDELPSQAQYDVVNRILDAVVNPMLAKDGGAVECAHMMDSSLIILKFLGNCSECTFSLTTTMDYIQDVFREELNKPELMMMTDS